MAFLSLAIAMRVVQVLAGLTTVALIGSLQTLSLDKPSYSLYGLSMVSFPNRWRVYQCMPLIESGGFLVPMATHEPTSLMYQTGRIRVVMVFYAAGYLFHSAIESTASSEDASLRNQQHHQCDDHL
jgi:hypothetical protein